MQFLSHNLQRLLARREWTLAELSARSGVDPRTLRGIVRGRHRPHARTVAKLAEGLEASVDELFEEPAQRVHRRLDRATNPLVDDLVAERPELFRGWSAAEFDELYSRVGTGGALTHEGAVASAQAMNARRELLHKVAVVCETDEVELLTGFVELLYQRVTCLEGEMVQPKTAAPPRGGREMVSRMGSSVVVAEFAKIQWRRE